jgi:catechol 2,3-dioxygenase-like lactoylglutathione lyase family enzyme
VRRGYNLRPAISRGKEIDMEPIISNLLTRFENGSLSRRELVQGLAMLAASGTAAAAQEDIDFKGADIDHVSIQVADMQRSVDFYEKMFGFSVISQDQPHGIIRLGTTRTLVSLNRKLRLARSVAWAARGRARLCGGTGSRSENPGQRRCGVVRSTGPVAVRHRRRWPTGLGGRYDRLDRMSVVGGKRSTRTGGGKNAGAGATNERRGARGAIRRVL